MSAGTLLEPQTAPDCRRPAAALAYRPKAPERRRRCRPTARSLPCLQIGPGAGQEAQRGWRTSALAGAPPSPSLAPQRAHPSFQSGFDARGVNWGACEPGRAGAVADRLLLACWAALRHSDEAGGRRSTSIGQMPWDPDCHVPAPQQAAPSSRLICNALMGHDKRRFLISCAFKVCITCWSGAGQAVPALCSSPSCCSAPSASWRQSPSCASPCRAHFCSWCCTAREQGGIVCHEGDNQPVGNASMQARMHKHEPARQHMCNMSMPTQANRHTTA